MKKIFLVTLLFAASFSSFAQTTTEISNILAGQTVTATGTITTQNLVPAGVATAGSAVELVLVNQSTLSIQITGTYTGALSLQTTVDGTNWATISDATALINISTGVQSATIASATQAQFSCAVEGLAKVRVTGLAAMTGTATVTMKAVTGAPLVTLGNPLPAGTAQIGGVNVSQINGVAPLMGNGVTGTGSARVTIASDNTANTNPWLIEQRTTTTNGSTASTLNSAATTNATNLKATAGLVYGIYAMNTSAATKYVRLFNKATAPVPGTDVPVLVIAIPATSSKEIAIPVGLKFATGIGYAITNAAAATDATAVAAGDVQLLINWQ